jgi:hypothetical protein
MNNNRLDILNWGDLYYFCLLLNGLFLLNNFYYWLFLKDFSLSFLYYSNGYSLIFSNNFNFLIFLIIDRFGHFQFLYFLMYYFFRTWIFFILSLTLTIIFIIIFCLFFILFMISLWTTLYPISITCNFLIFLIFIMFVVMTCNYCY